MEELLSGKRLDAPPIVQVPVTFYCLHPTEERHRETANRLAECLRPYARV